MLRKNISILIWGHIHRDPLAYQVLAKQISDLHEQKIPMVFCEEDIAEQNLKNRLLGNQQFIDMNLKLLSHESIVALLKKDKNLSYPYLLLSDLEKLKREISQLFPMMSKYTVSELAFGLLRHPAIQESIHLNNLLSKINLPYLGIEYSKEKREVMQHMINANKNMYVTMEQSRITEMVSNIMNKAISQLPENGVVIVFCGINHCHRLAANLSLTCKTLKDKMNLKIFPIKFISPYAIDGLSAHHAAEADTKFYDSKEVLKTYLELPCYDLICKNEWSSLTKEITAHSIVKSNHPNMRLKLFDYLTTNDLRMYTVTSKKHHQLTTAELHSRKISLSRLNPV